MLKYLLVTFNFIVFSLGLFIAYVLIVDGINNKDSSVGLINIAREFMGKPLLQVAKLNCMPQSIEGSTFVFDYPVLHARNTKMIQLELSNQFRDKSILLHLNAPDDPSRRIVSSLIPSRGTVTIHVPADQYSVSFNMGDHFCNLNRGFLSNQKKIKIKQPLDLETKNYATLTIDDGAVSNGGLKISLHETESEINSVTSSSSDAYLTVPMSRDGHFYISAMGNGFPLVFLIDSGATNVAIPAQFMKNLGVGRCEAITTNTANGLAKGCKAMLKEISIGSYKIKNVNVVFMEKLHTPLLGMNVLNKFSMYKVGDVLQLAYKWQ